MTDDSFDPRYDPAFQRGFDRDRPATSPAGQTDTRGPRAEPPPTAVPRPFTPATEAPIAVAPSAREPIWGPMREPTRVRVTAEPAVPRMPAQPRAPATAASGATTHAAADASAAAGTSAAADTDLAPRPGTVLRGNPFVYALIGVGVFLTVLGLWGQWGAADGRTGSYRSPDELVLDEFLAGIGPWCMTLGIGTLVTVLVLYALHWRTPK